MTHVATWPSTIALASAQEQRAELHRPGHKNVRIGIFVRADLAKDDHFGAKSTEC
jgi:hypothetical protein